MPGFIALKLCPHLIFATPNFSKYKQASLETRAVFRDFDPDFDAGSLDEAYLDVTEYCQKSGMSGAQVWKCAVLSLCGALLHCTWEPNRAALTWTAPFSISRAQVWKLLQVLSHFCLVTIIPQCFPRYVHRIWRWCCVFHFGLFYSWQIKSLASWFCNHTRQMLWIPWT